MIIWSGKGILSILVLVAACAISLKILPDTHMDQAFALACFITGAFSWVFGKKWNGAQRIVIDEQTGKRIVLRHDHSIFFIKMHYWGIVFFALGGILIFQGFTKVLGSGEMQSLDTSNAIWVRSIVLTLCLLLLIVSIKRKPKGSIKETRTAENKPFESPQKEIEKNESSFLAPTPPIDKEEHSRFMPNTNL